MPVRMGMQLFPALVDLVEGIEKGDRVGDVDEDRDLQLGGGLPQWIEAGVINGDKLAVMIAHLKAKALPDLETLGAAPDLLGKAGGCPPGKTIPLLRPPAPVDPAEMVEAVRCTVLEVVEVPVEDLLAPAAVHVGHRFHTAFVHGVQQLGERAADPTTAPQRSQVVVRIDDWKTWVHWRVVLTYQRRAWSKIVQQQAIDGHRFSPPLGNPTSQPLPL